MWLALKGAGAGLVLVLAPSLLPNEMGRLPSVLCRGIKKKFRPRTYCGDAAEIARNARRSQSLDVSAVLRVDSRRCK
eukprot:3305837-Pleurochrysis_carterae.AAC.1